MTIDMLLRGRSDRYWAAWRAIINDGTLTVTLVESSVTLTSQAPIPPDASCWQCAVDDRLHACISDIEVQARGRWIARWRLNTDDPIERARRNLLRGWKPCPDHNGETNA